MRKHFMTQNRILNVSMQKRLAFPAGPESHASNNPALCAENNSTAGLTLWVCISLTQI